MSNINLGWKYFSYRGKNGGGLLKDAGVPQYGDWLLPFRLGRRYVLPEGMSDKEFHTWGWNFSFPRGRVVLKVTRCFMLRS